MESERLERTADELRERFSETGLYREAFGPPRPQTSEKSPHKPGDFEVLAPSTGS